MIHVWTWDGKYFGYIENNNLWTYSGKHIGKCVDGEIYNNHGKYIGEVMSENRLIVNTQKKHKIAHNFTPFANTAGHAKYADYVGYVMYAGHENFPDPDTF